MHATRTRRCHSWQMKGKKVHKSSGAPIVFRRWMRPKLPLPLHYPPSLSFFEVGHLISSPVPTSSSPCHYTQFKSKRSLTPLLLIENPESNPLTSENHPFYQGLQSLSFELNPSRSSSGLLRMISSRDVYFFLNSNWSFSKPPRV